MLHVVVFTIFFYLIFPHVQILIITKKNKTFCNNIGLRKTFIGFLLRPLVSVHNIIFFVKIY